MSLTRRLYRIARANLGALRGDSFEDAEMSDERREEPFSSDPGSPAEKSASEIPPDVVDAYRALEVPVGSDRETVKKGYRRVMKQYHQDRFQQDEEKRTVAGEVSKRINLAYERVIEYLDDAHP